MKPFQLKPFVHLKCSMDAKGSSWRHGW